jgi:hypothetical protein
VVGAKGFEPSTSWSRTSGQNHISRCPGVTYWFSGRSLMDKSGQATAECWRLPRGIDSENCLIHNPSVNSLETKLITSCRSRDKSRGLATSDKPGQAGFTFSYRFCLQIIAIYHNSHVTYMTPQVRTTKSPTALGAHDPTPTGQSPTLTFLCFQ